MATVQKITPFLWFDDNAEEAMNLYVSIFKNARVLDIVRYGSSGPGKPGTAMTVSFELEGLRFTGLNGGPMFKFTEAVSFAVECDTQEEVDRLWNKLTADGGSPSQCAWLKDKFGLSWQIVPRVLIAYLKDPDPAKAGRVMQAMMKMTRIDIAALDQAYAG
jgi:predicted 3-demethylubiquinone-9 3-methyltransferase (glyoxalase superfamily)